MKRWSDRTLARVADFSATIAEAPHWDQSRARAALDGLSGLIPFDCAVVCRADGGSLSLAAAIGHRDGVESAIGREEYRLEQTALGMDLSSAPLRFCDLPDGGRSSFTATELAWPAGLRDGMGMTLTSPSGGLVGHIALNAVRNGTFTDDHRDLLGLLARPLSVAVCDPAVSLGSPAFGLTRREREVLGLIMEGHTNTQIAEMLTVTRSTVRRHVEHVLRKLDVTSRTAAAVKASQYDVLRTTARARSVN